MRVTSIIAIYLLFWWGCLFLVLPFRLRTSQEPEAFVLGQVESATPRFSVWRTTIWTTVVSVAMFAAFYVNYLYGWISVDIFDMRTW